MHYSTALVLSTLAVGQAAAGTIRHASFHARREAEQKRGNENANVNWGGVVRDVVDYSTVDYSKVNWSKMDWSSILKTPSATPAPSSAPTPQVQAAAVKPTTTAAAYTPPAAASSAKPSSTPSNTDNSGTIGGAKVANNQLLTGVDTLIKKMGIAGQGENAVSDNGFIWISDDNDKSPWKTTFTNGASQNVMALCWKKLPGSDPNSYKDMCLNAVKPLISVMIPPGKSVTVSHKEGASGSCGGAYPDTILSPTFGGLYNSWYEFTFTKTNSRFDISLEVNGNGNQIEAKGSKCTSSNSQCVFKCSNGSTSCQNGYSITNPDKQQWCDASTGTNGGCQCGADSEHVTVTFK